MCSKYTYGKNIHENEKSVPHSVFRFHNPYEIPFPRLTKPNKYYLYLLGFVKREIFLIDGYEFGKINP